MRSALTWLITSSDGPFVTCAPKSENSDKVPKGCPGGLQDRHPPFSWIDMGFTSSGATNSEPCCAEPGGNSLDQARLRVMRLKAWTKRLPLLLSPSFHHVQQQQHACNRSLHSMKWLSALKAGAASRGCLIIGFRHLFPTQSNPSKASSRPYDGSAHTDVRRPAPRDQHFWRDEFRWWPGGTFGT